jgi:hypothetical protein
VTAYDRSWLRAPLPAEWTVERGLEIYLLENGFDRVLYDAPKTPASFLGVSFTVPNTPQHRWALMRHDLHHVATGFGTDIPGEAEVSVWELVGGVPNIGLYTAGIVTSIAMLGYARYPRRSLAARRASKAISLFQDVVPYETALAMRIGDLRVRLGMPERGIASARRLHARAPTW